MTPNKLLICVLLAMLALLYGVGAQAANTKDQEREYKLKAAFLLNFSKFTTWPKGTFPEPGQTFNFCIVGENPFGTAFDGLESKKIGGRAVQLHYAASIAKSESCHVMFISKSEQSNLGQLKQKIGQQPIVTVSDINEFSQQGGVFEFITKAGRLSFIVNNQQATHSGLQINASLLNLAAEVF